MNKPLLLDTDVFVDFLRGHPAAVAYVTARVNRIVLCPLVAAELYAGVRDNEELERLDEFLSLFPVADLTRDIARQPACTSGIFISLTELGWRMPSSPPRRSCRGLNSRRST